MISPPRRCDVGDQWPEPSQLASPSSEMSVTGMGLVNTAGGIPCIYGPEYPIRLGVFKSRIRVLLVYLGETPCLFEESPPVFTCIPTQVARAREAGAHGGEAAPAGER